MFDYTHISVEKDAYLAKTYDVIRANARDVRNYLLKTYKAKGIDVNKFNMTEKSHDFKHVPIEIYEYQNFFLLQDENDEFTLLDGFRRLLWYDAPDHMITIRVYKHVEMQKTDVMKMLVYLNHFKFYGLGEYYDRGFALTLYTLYGIDIPKIQKMFDAYLTENVQKYYYINTESKDGDDASKTVIKLMTESMFVDNMKFLSDMKDTNQMINKYFAIQFRNFIKEYKKPLTAKEFIDKVKGNKVLDDLLLKYHKLKGISSSAEATKLINQITDIYTVIFNEFLGKKTDKPYAVVFSEMKAASEEIKKTKGWIKLTKKRDVRDVEKKMTEIIKNGETPKIKMVVYPYKHNLNDKDVIGALPGVYDNFIMKIEKAKNYPYHDKIIVSLIDEKGEVIGDVKHGWAGGYSYARGTVYIEFKGSYTYFKKQKKDLFQVREVDIDLYINFDNK